MFFSIYQDVIYTLKEEPVIIILALSAVTAVLLVFCAIQMVQIRRLKKRVNKFFGTGDDQHDLEHKLMHCLVTVSGVDAKYSDLVEGLASLEKRVNNCGRYLLLSEGELHALNDGKPKAKS